MMTTMTNPTHSISAPESLTPRLSPGNILSCRTIALAALGLLIAVAALLAGIAAAPDADAAMPQECEGLCGI